MSSWIIIRMHFGHSWAVHTPDWRVHSCHFLKQTIDKILSPIILQLFVWIASYVTVHAVYVLYQFLVAKNIIIFRRVVNDKMIVIVVFANEFFLSILIALEFVLFFSSLVCNKKVLRHWKLLMRLLVRTVNVLSFRLERFLLDFCFFVLVSYDIY